MMDNSFKAMFSVGAISSFDFIVVSKWQADNPVTIKLAVKFLQSDVWRVGKSFDAKATC